MTNKDKFVAKVKIEHEKKPYQVYKKFRRNN